MCTYKKKKFSVLIATFPCRDTDPRIGDVLLVRAPYLKVQCRHTHTHIVYYVLLTHNRDTYVRSTIYILQLYSEYISKFDKALKTLEEVTKKNPLFAEVLHEFEAQPKCANLPLAGYMLEIVQRIPRYKMLLSGEGHMTGM